MSFSCNKMSELSLTDLEPHWVEFTPTKGVLRVLKPQEDTSRAQGMIFQCPRCKDHQKKAHFCIFLFDNAREGARPSGRFAAARNSQGELRPFETQALHELPNEPRTSFFLLRPRDMDCRWEGYLVDGIVSWRPNFFERWAK